MHEMAAGDMPMNETLTRGDRLGDQVYRWLTASITAGSYAPNDRINIRRLAEELRSSVTPVREAVLRLVAEGVLETTATSAIIVPSRTEFELLEIFDIRRCLEGEMAYAAAPNITDSDVEYLTQVQGDFLKALDNSDYQEVLKQNAIFHFTIYRRASLPLRLKITETLWLRVGPTLRHMYPYLHQKRGDHRRHEDVIDAAARRHAADLRSAIHADLASSQAALQHHVQDRDSQPKRRMRRKVTLDTQSN